MRRRVDGTEWWVSMNSRPIRLNGRECTMVWHFDITERKQAEKALRQARDELERRAEERTRELIDEIAVEARSVEIELSKEFQQRHEEGVEVFQRDLAQLRSLR